MLPPVVGPLATHPSAGVGAPMSYAPQWPTNVTPHGISPNQVSPQGEILQNSATISHNGVLYGAYNPNSLRQHASQLHIPMVGGQNVNQASPSPSGTGFCPAPLPSGYSLLNPALLTAFAAQPSATSTRPPNFYIQQGSAQPGAVRGALLSSHAFQLAHPGSHNISPGPVCIGQQPTLHNPFQYIPTPNGLQLAAFSASITSPPGITNPSMCSFAHPSPMQHGSQQQPNSLGPVQFRSYDSLKHFGALPHPQNQKRNKSMTTSKTNLYISGLSESDTDETVRALVEDVVCPKSCKAMLLNGRCKGSGFIDCVSEEDAIKALNHLSELARNGGRKLNVKYALENEKDLLNVYVKNLPRTGFTKETLENLFRPYGQVTSVKLLETDGNYTGIGFVRFASAEQAQRAVESMNEARCVLADSPGGGKPISCKLADKVDSKRRAVNAAAAMAAAAAAAAASVTGGGGGGGSHPASASGRDGRQQSFSASAVVSCSNDAPHQAVLPNATHLLQTPQQHQQPGLANLIFQPGVLTDGTVVSIPPICPPSTYHQTAPAPGYRQPTTSTVAAATACDVTATLGGMDYTSPTTSTCTATSLSGRGALLEAPLNSSLTQSPDVQGLTLVPPASSSPSAHVPGVESRLQSTTQSQQYMTGSQPQRLTAVTSSPQTAYAYPYHLQYPMATQQLSPAQPLVPLTQSATSAYSASPASSPRDLRQTQINLVSEFQALSLRTGQSAAVTFPSSTASGEFVDCARSGEVTRPSGDSKSVYPVVFRPEMSLDPYAVEPVMYAATAAPKPPYQQPSQQPEAPQPSVEGNPFSATTARVPVTGDGLSELAVNVDGVQQQQQVAITEDHEKPPESKDIDAPKAVSMMEAETATSPPRRRNQTSPQQAHQRLAPRRSAKEVDHHQQSTRKSSVHHSYQRHTPSKSSSALSVAATPSTPPLTPGQEDSVCADGATPSQESGHSSICANGTSTVAFSA
uniref:RRM domain-containing protein n=1 Tax=Schistocephalus solidus TaxID=70667 RepID=A0A0X3P8B1_SCHSO